MILFLGKEGCHCNFLGTKLQRCKVTKVYIEDAQYGASFFVLGLSIEMYSSLSLVFRESFGEAKYL